MGIHWGIELSNFTYEHHHDAAPLCYPRQLYPSCTRAISTPELSPNVVVARRSYN